MIRSQEQNYNDQTHTIPKQFIQSNKVKLEQDSTMPTSKRYKYKIHKPKLTFTTPQIYKSFKHIKKNQQIHSYQKQKQVKMKMKRCPGFVFIKKDEVINSQKDPIQNYIYNSQEIINQLKQNKRIYQDFSQKKYQIIEHKKRLKQLTQNCEKIKLSPSLLKFKEIVNNKIIPKLKKQNIKNKVTWNNVLNLDTWINQNNNFNKPFYYNVKRNNVKDNRIKDLSENDNNELINYNEYKLDQLYYTTEMIKKELKKEINKSPFQKNFINSEKIMKVLKLIDMKKKINEAFYYSFKTNRF